MVLDFGLLSSGLFPASDASGQGMTGDTNTIIWNDVGIGIIPIGGIVAWAKSLAGIPPLLPSFVECNGQVLVDGDSPLNGVTIPDLNGGVRFLRGSAASGAIGGAATNAHSHSRTSILVANTATGTNYAWHGDYRSGTETINILPPYYCVVWVMRVK